MPILGAFIGWFTNFLAVKMLFHPKEPRRFLFYTFQGVFPRRQAALAEKLGEVVAEQLITAEEIGQQLATPVAKERVKRKVEEFLDAAIRQRLPAAIPMVGMFLTPDLIQTVKGAFAGDLDQFISGALKDLSGSLGETLDVRELVRAKVAAFSSDRLEELLVALMKKEFTFIEVSGGILGALIGVIQACLV